MATVYNIEVTSHWVNFPEEELKILIENAIKKSKEFGHSNQITIEIKDIKRL
jgi:hypothetical protein